jgi:clan AA aspartic protease
MGLVKVKAQIGPNREQLSEIEFLVDTGGFYSAISSALRDQLELSSGVLEHTQLADSSIVEVEVTLAHLSINGREGAIPVEIMNVPEPLLGASALEVLGMKVNPVTRKLEIDRPYEHPPTVTRWSSQTVDA